MNKMKRNKNNSNFLNLTRRDFIGKSIPSLAGIAITSSLYGKQGFAKNNILTEDTYPNSTSSLSLQKGQIFNESLEFPDRLTGRITRVLTCNRKFNRTPTYHLNACFSADSRYMILSSILENGSSALLRAEVATGDIKVIATQPAGEPPFDASIIQASGQIVSEVGKSLKIYDPDSLEEKILTENKLGYGHPVSSYDGKKIFVTRNDQPTVINGIKIKPVTHLQIDISSGKTTEIFKETEAQCSHVQICPSNPDLLLIDRDWAPLFFAGGNLGKTGRIWILNIKTKELTEIRPKNENKFVMHSNWSHNGDFIYYHGADGPVHDGPHNGSWVKQKGKHFIGVADLSGNSPDASHIFG